MDFFKSIDGEPCLKLLADSSFNVYISSVWGSLSVESEKELAAKKCYDLACPHCKTSFKTSQKCQLCNSDLISMNLNHEGNTLICSQRGCSYSKLQVGDTDEFISKSSQVSESKTTPYLKPLGEIEKKVFLNSQCPTCQESIVSDNLLKFKTNNSFLYIEPFINIYKHQKDIEFAKNISAENLYCTSCSNSLLKNQSQCSNSHNLCAQIYLIAMNESIPFNFCIDKDCLWQEIDNDSFNKLLLEDSGQW